MSVLQKLRWRCLELAQSNYVYDCDWRYLGSPLSRASDDYDVCLVFEMGVLRWLKYQAALAYWDFYFDVWKRRGKVAA